MTDQGSDITAIPQSLLKMICSTGLDVEEISFSKTRRYNPIVKTKNVEVTCSKKVKLDAILRIRHGSKLILRNVWWNVTNEDIPFCLFGRLELEALGLNNKIMLQAAADRLDGVADMSSLQPHDKDETLDQAVRMIDEDPPSMIANLMADHTFYSN